MIETRRLNNAVIFIQTILSFVLSRKIKKQKWLYTKFKKISCSLKINTEKSRQDGD